MAELTIVLNKLCSFCHHTKEEHYAPGKGCVARMFIIDHIARCVCLKYLGADMKYFLAPQLPRVVVLRGHCRHTSTLEERSTYVP